MVEDEIDTSWLERVEDMAVERSHVDRAILLDMQVVVVLGDPEQIDFFRQLEFAG